MIEDLINMSAQKIIKMSEVSRLLVGTRSVVTRKRMPEKHEKKVKELINIVQNWCDSLKK